MQHSRSWENCVALHVIVSLTAQFRFQLPVRSFLVIGLQPLAPFAAGARRFPALRMAEQRGGLLVVGVSFEHGAEAIRRCRKLSRLPLRTSQVEAIIQV